MNSFSLDLLSLYFDALCISCIQRKKVVILGLITVSLILVHSTQSLSYGTEVLGVGLSVSLSVENVS